MKKKGFCLLLILLFIASCAGMTDTQRTQVEGTALGAGLGAALGAGIGAAVGGKQGAALGALVGGLLGGGAGAAWGTHVASKKTQYANTEDYLDAVIQKAKS